MRREQQGGLWWAAELERRPRKVRIKKWTARKGGLFYREGGGGLQVFICSSEQHGSRVCVLAVFQQWLLVQLRGLQKPVSSSSTWQPEA